MTYINELVGGVLLVLGLITFIICLAAFVKVTFGSAKRRERGAKEILAEINSLIQNWTAALKLLPRAVRSLFLLLPFAVLLIIGGLYILIYKPIAM
jgi:hypothetical protein